VDPDRVSLPPGAHEVIRVSWCPLKPSRTVYCGTIHVVLDGGSGGGGGGAAAATTLKVRLRGAPVTEGDGAGVPGALSYSTRRASAAGAGGGNTAGNSRRSSILQPLNGNAVASRVGSSPGGKRSRADCDRVGDCDAASSSGGGGSVASRFGGTNGSSFTSSAAPEQRRKAPRVAPVAKTLSLRKPKPGAKSPKRRQLAEGERPNFEEFHTQFWVGQQERAFTNWLNLTIVPAAAGGSSAAAVNARSRRHTAAAARSRLWQLYSRDPEVRDGGVVQLSNLVYPWLGSALFQPLNLKYHLLVLNFAFECNLYRYNTSSCAWSGTWWGSAR
jgi:abnormal spindle-like microcephaly-associated protein